MVVLVMFRHVLSAVKRVYTVEEGVAIVDRIIATNSPLEHVLRLLHCNIAVKPTQLAAIKRTSCCSFDWNAELRGLLIVSITAAARNFHENVRGLLHDRYVIEFKVSLPHLILLRIQGDERLSIILNSVVVLTFLRRYLQ